jgi:RHS repeat-associated protein
VSPSGTTLYLADAMASGVLAEKVTGLDVQWNNYLMVDRQLIGMVVERSDETTYTRYFHKDHLGSIAVITDEAGTVVERLSYDAWGRRRFPDGSDDPSGSITSQTTRGFTGHEELGDVSLVHMNGRVYDPLLGRFGSPDPTTENPFSTQGWNRYSYVGNSPLNFTDPSGYCFLGCFWHSMFRSFANLLRSTPILGAILKIAATVLCVGFEPVCAVLASSFVAGVTSGKLGVALKAGLVTALTIGAFHIAGDLTGLFPGAPNGGHADLVAGSEAHLFNIAAHALVGCASSVAGGGKCGPGALSAGIPALAGPALNGWNSDSKLVANAVIGGTASVAGGGSFANGAVTGAFSYLFNHMAPCAVGDQTCGRGALAPASPGGGGADLNLGIGAAGVSIGAWFGAQINAISDWLSGSMLNSDDDTAPRPPAGSRPIDQTPWSGNHQEIKDAIGAGPEDNVRISPTGDVWAQNPDGSWTSHGPASDYTGSGEPRGRRGKDRDG